MWVYTVCWCICLLLSSPESVFILQKCKLVLWQTVIYCEDQDEMQQNADALFAII